METTDSQKDNFFANRCVFEIRNHLKLDQGEFGNAIGKNQSTISVIEANKIKVSRPIRNLIHTTFFVNLEFFEAGTESNMFLEGREPEALEKAGKFRKPERDGNNGLKSRPPQTAPADSQMIKIEKLTAELEYAKGLLESREELLESRDEMIVLLKSQLSSVESRYENISKELAELRNLVDQGIAHKLNEISDKITSGENQDPNGLNPAKRSG